MKFKKIFVTVGTTEFNELIAKLTETATYEVFKNIGCEQLTVQIGRGEKKDFSHFDGIKVDVFDLKKSIAEDIEAADLVSFINCVVFNFLIFYSFQVISHAGAGSCIDVLSQGKYLLVVINNSLMNNHQSELAEQLANDNYLYHTTTNNLPDALKNFDTEKLKTYEKGNVDKFIEYLDASMGFS